MKNRGTLPWRTAEAAERTIYDADGTLIGTLDTPELAALTIASVNARAPNTPTTTPPPERGMNVRFPAHVKEALELLSVSEDRSQQQILERITFPAILAAAARLR
jgi:hypothetical protein